MGRGSCPAKILFIGEAPGKTEDLLGEPFVGASGKLLDAMLEDAGYTNEYYITNTVFCRPTDEPFGANREPKDNEVLACRKNFMRIFEVVKPRFVIFVGKVAERFYSKEFPHSVTILHPSFILRKGGKISPFYMHNVNILKRVLNEKEISLD
jgi:DNA polymerase